jgi:diguanylate cyclase (GGDEF)-like protein
MADAMLQGIRELAIAHAVSAVAPVVTASLGVAAIVPRMGVDQAELIEIADRCLYEAKKRGRNRVHTDNVLSV